MLRLIGSIARMLLPGSVVRALRGKHNSVYFRFFGNPTNLISIKFSNLIGVSYLEWYGKRLSTYTGRSAEELAKSGYLKTGKEDLQAAINRGLKTEHSFYEFGTGQGRSSAHFIRYLQPHLFFGNDAAEGRVREFLEFMKLHELEDKHPTVWVNTSNDFGWVPIDRHFDYLWCNAVLCHMPDKDASAVIANIKKIMHDDSKFLLVETAVDGSEKVMRYNFKDWFRPASWYIAEAQAAGLKAVEASEALSYGSGSHNKNAKPGDDQGFTYSTFLLEITKK